MKIALFHALFFLYPNIPDKSHFKKHFDSTLSGNFNSTLSKNPKLLSIF